MFNSIDRDGSLEGLDLVTLESIADLFDRPVLIAGGLGNWRQLMDALSKSYVDGAATSNVYHLTDTAMQLFRNKLTENGIPLRQI